MKRLRLLAIFIGSVFVFSQALSSEQNDESLKAVEDDEQTAAPYAYLDAARIQVGQRARLVVVLPSDSSFDGEPVVLTPHSIKAMRIDEPTELSLSNRAYAIDGTVAGEYRFLVSFFYTDDTDTKRRWFTQLDLQVDSKPAITLGAGGGVLIGAALALLSSFGTSMFNQWISDRRRQKQLKAWLSDVLVPRLEMANLDIADRRVVELVPWMNQLYEGGYFSSVRELDDKESESPLASRLVEIHSLLVRYNATRTEVAIDADFVQSVTTRLDSVLNELRLHC